MTNRIVGPFLAVCIGLLVFWGIGEGACRLYFRNHLSFDVEMWRYARQVKTTGLTPGIRFEHRPESKAKLMGVNVEINSQGLRDREFPGTKTPGHLRVAVVGDSVTFGWGVAQDETYPRQLEDELNRLAPLGSDKSFEMMNFGVGNYAINDVAATLRHKVLAYQPDLVIYGAFINDAEESTMGREIPILQHSMFAVWLWGRIDALKRRMGWEDDYRQYYAGLYSAGGAGRERVAKGMSEMRDLCIRRGIPLVVVLFPEMHNGSSLEFQKIRGFFRDTAQRLKVVFVDLAGALPTGDKRSFWVSDDDAHPNAEAFHFFAQYSGQLVPWRELLETDLSPRRD